jgi:hypothetical protein
VFALAHGLLIGLGAGAGFRAADGRCVALVSSGAALAVVIAACGSYFAGTLWPLVMNQTIPLYGWRATHIGIGIAILVVMLPLT